MSSSKNQQSFSSYSSGEGGCEQKYCAKPLQEEQDQFSEYEQVNHNTHQYKIQKNNQNNKKIPQEKRRYSYGSIDYRKHSAYNYLNGYDNIPYYRPNYAYGGLKNPKQAKFFLGAGSPCGIPNLDNTSILQFSQHYLNGLQKYYNSHNYIKKLQPKHSISSSVDKNRIDRPLNRSEYWNGQKFDYFNMEKSVQIDKKSNGEQNNVVKDSQHKTKKSLNQRNLTSGLIVNKKQLKETKHAQSIKPKQDTSGFIKIQQHPSNSKHLSEHKPSLSKLNSTAIQNNHPNNKIRQVLIERDLKQNTEIQVKNSKNSKIKTNLQQIKMNSSVGSSLMQKQYSSLLAERNQLASQNQNLKATLKSKDQQIQSLLKQRITDNDEYMGKIQNLKKAFEGQKNAIIKDYQSEISIYKSVRKQALKSEFIKEQTQKIALTIENNNLEKQLKRVQAELNNLEKQLNRKNSIIKSLEQKVALCENHKQSNNQNSMIGKNVSTGKQKQTTKNKIEKETAQKVPEWIKNFLNVFKNMIVKLLGQLNPNWSQKKIIIIGWKVVKIIIQKAVKIGIRIPEIANQDQDGECSIISHPQNTKKSPKKYHLNRSKKPIRI